MDIQEGSSIVAIDDRMPDPIFTVVNLGIVTKIDDSCAIIKWQEDGEEACILLDHISRTPIYDSDYMYYVVEEVV